MMFFAFRAIIAAIILFANTLAFASTPHHTIIVDAGSSGSRLHLFRYETTDQLPIIEEVFSQEVKPGISSFNNPADAATSLHTLFDGALSYLNTKQIDLNTVTVHVLATAGMRLLPTEKADETYQAIRTSLQQRYAFMLGDITTVPEKLEGVYGWLDVNYLASNFDKDAATTVGIIDVGGASTEIAFATQDASKADDITPITINGITYNVFSKNFLGLGQDQARLAINNNADAATCYPINYELSPANNGRFNMATCGNLYADLIKQHRVAEQLAVISNQQHFIAYSGAYYDYHFLDIDHHPQQAAIEQRIQNVCLQSWNQLKTNYTNVQDKYLANYCANSVYVTSLLFNTYHLQNDQLEVKNNINGKNIDWALGALFYKIIEARG